jgi:ELWxxDGT repeat protein
MHPLEDRVLLSVNLVADVNARPVEPLEPPSGLTELCGSLYFAAYDGVRGPALWRSDGTTAGTSLVRAVTTDFNNPSISGLAAANGLLYFAAADTTGGIEPWRSDGTPAGTYRLVDAFPGGTSSSSPSRFTALGSATYFFASTGAGTALWRTDGTSAGTSMVKVVGPGQFKNEVGAPVVVNGVMYFLDQSQSNGSLWVSDGTAGGTQKLQSFATVGASGLTWFNGALYLNIDKRRLFRSDGTTAPMTLVAAPDGANLANLTVAGNRLYFTADTLAGGNELWSSNGTTASVVKELATNDGSRPSELTAFNGRLFFSADDRAANGRELWSTDGTAAGTSMINLRPGGVSSDPKGLGVANGSLYLFADTDAVAGPELWVSDGTAAGTRQVRAFTSASTPAPSFRAFGANAYFVASDGVTGTEVWRTDGTAANTALVRDVFVKTSPARPEMIATLGGRAYFFADDGYHGKEVWSTDGTAAGTALLLDSRAGSAGSFTRGGGIATSKYVYYQQSTSSGGGYAIGRTDGTFAGTVQSPVDGPITDWAAAGDRVFAVSDASQLWVTDATGINWRPLDGKYFGGPMVVAADGTVYAVGPSPTRELWRTDGTDAGTYRVADLNPAGADSVMGLTAVGNDVYFFAQDGTGTGNKLYKSDGTAAGTVLVKDVNPGGDDWVRSLSRWDGTAAAGGRLFFSATGSDGFVDLWTSDGTAAGTQPVPGDAGGGPRYLVGFGDAVVYSAAYNGTLSLMRSDGTAEGTYALAPVKFGSTIYPFASTSLRIGDILYVSATTPGSNRNVLWRTDGTVAGTWVVSNVDPGGTGVGNDGQLLPLGNDVLVTADDKVHELEVYRVSPPAAPPLNATSATFAPGGGAAAGLTYAFDHPLATAPAPADLVLKNLTAGNTVPAANVRLAGGEVGAAAPASSVTFTFPGYPGALLPDGNYRATLTAGSATDANGDPLARDATLDFYVLAGDATGDRVVNFDDLLVLAKNYNKADMAFAQGDFTGDGLVNFDDLLVLAKNYNKTVPADGAAPAPAAAIDVQALAAAMGIATPTAPKPAEAQPPAAAKRPAASPKPVTPPATPPATPAIPAPSRTAPPARAASLLRDDSKPRPVFSTTPVLRPSPAPAKPKVAAHRSSR